MYTTKFVVPLNVKCSIKKKIVKKHVDLSRTDYVIAEQSTMIDLVFELLTNLINKIVVNSYFSTNNRVKYSYKSRYVYSKMPNRKRIQG